MLLDDRERIPSAPDRLSVRFGRASVYMVVVACLCVGIWIERESLLRSMADNWIVSDALTRSDAAVVLGGGLQDRPFGAAELYRHGLVQKVLISQVLEDRTAAMGIVASHTELNRQVLLKLGVPASAIETFGTANESTKDE